ncbi:SH3 domain-containing protein [Romboutsia lituseburensis]|uniref:SH3 domain-containing protein n=1 Tax=Romboutsia lituseburensis TaxID=1537 RepID=UPI0022EB518D|nr:SH3 domain-containing protein [Romboutsia lituseburensis]
MDFKKYASTLVIGAMVFTSGGVIAHAQTDNTSKAATSVTTVSTKANDNITVLDKTGTATHDVYIRDSSNTKGKILGTLNKNKTIKVTGKTKDGWYKVDYNGKVGYVYGSYVKINATSDNNSNNNNSNITVLDKTGTATHDVYIRDNSNTKGKILGTLNKNKTIKVTGKTKDGWYKVDYNGKVGYVYGSYVKINATSDNNSNNNNSNITVLDKTGTATHDVYIRDNSNTKGKILGTLNKNKTIKITGKTKYGWYKVDFNGKIGYVYSSYVKIGA